jgi:hypothetical protein
MVVTPIGDVIVILPFTVIVIGKRVNIRANVQ